MNDATVCDHSKAHIDAVQNNRIWVVRLAECSLCGAGWQGYVRASAAARARRRAFSRWQAETAGYPREWAD